MNIKYLTRITPNTNSWQHPSGCKYKCGGNLYENFNDFGWEEWLFNKLSRKDGYQYGFLQCFNSHNLNKEISYDEVYLYTRKCETKGDDCKQKSNRGECYLVARICNVTKLSFKEATEIEKEFGENGNINDMRKKCPNKKKFDLRPTNNKFIFNVKFKPEDTQLIDNKTSIIPSNYHFVIVNLQHIRNSQKRNSIINSINQSSFNQNI
jgi:hypothetical protein